MRNCSCIRWWLRTTGSDKFDDFDLFVQVHDISTGSPPGSSKYYVRLQAGDQDVSTTKQKKSFHEVLSILIEQGTETLDIALMGDNGSVLAYSSIDIDDILAEGQSDQKTYHLTRKSKHVSAPTVTMTLFASTPGDTEDALADVGSGGDMETTFLMRQHLAQVQQQVQASGESGAGAGSRGSIIGMDNTEHEVLTVLMQSCSGPVSIFGTLGVCKKRHIHIKGPPAIRRYVIGIWKDEKEVDKNAAETEIELTKVTNVACDPQKPDHFHINYIESKVSRSMTLRTSDRNAKVWVESLMLLITRVRALKNHEKKKGR